MRHAIVNKDGLIVNVVIWKGAKWKAPDNHYVVYSPVCNIGDRYDIENDILIVANRTQQDEIVVPQEEQPSLESLQKQLDELKSQLLSKGE